MPTSVVVGLMSDGYLAPGNGRPHSERRPGRCPIGLSSRHPPCRECGIVVLELFAEDPKTANRLSVGAARAHLIERGYTNDLGSPACIKPGLDHPDFRAPLSF